MLILAGAGRLDKDLMIAQMSVYFQLAVIPEAGPFVQEDVPQNTAGLLMEFFKTNDRSFEDCLGPYSVLTNERRRGIQSAQFLLFHFGTFETLPVRTPVVEIWALQTFDLLLLPMVVCGCLMSHSFTHSTHSCVALLVS